MKHYTVFSKSTGEALRHLSCADEQLAGNVGPDDVLIEGPVDMHAHRLGTDGQVIADSARANAMAARVHSHAIRARISELEGNGVRAQREFALGYDGAKARLQAIDDEIVTLRTRLTT